MERASMETRARVGNIAWLWTINSKEDEGEGPIRKENAREIPTLSRFSGFDPIPRPPFNPRTNVCPDSPRE